MKKVILAALLPALLGGCYIAAEDQVGYVAPPPPRYAVVEERPGYLWIDGHYYWYGSQWLWADGYYVLDRPGYAWIGGYYRGHTYYPGHWGRRPGVYRSGPSQATRAIDRARGGSRAGDAIRGQRAPLRAAPAPTYRSPARAVPSRSYQAPARSAPARSAPAAPARQAPSAPTHVRDHRH